jgi:phosphoribosylaminoimidazolecarboxamide formyltransferase / IMP cyclohydrolase
MKRAIISVSDKTNIVELANFLLVNDFQIYSTGGTYKLLSSSTSNPSNIKPIQELTNFPEILNGRVKTLHPHIYAGLLANIHNPDHLTELENLNLPTIELVVCNLYPFFSTQSIENIDIGGVTLMRASSKNHESVIILSNPSQYDSFISKFTQTTQTTQTKITLLGHSLEDRKKLAQTCFQYVSNYDNRIAKFLSNQQSSQNQPIQLKYGMNPHQSQTSVSYTTQSEPFKLLNGTLSMINTIDIIHGWLTVKEIQTILNLPTAISMKHTSLAGLAVGYGITEVATNYYKLSPEEATQVSPTAIAFMKSRLGDPLSSFGDIIVISHQVDVLTAKLIKNEITDGIAAPSYEPEALEILKTKKNGQFKIVEMDTNYYDNMIKSGWQESKEIYGIKLSQSNNNYINTFANITNEKTRIDHVIAHTALKYAQSNNISMAVDGQIIGMGCGQQNRVGCVNLAGSKATNWVLRHTSFAKSFWNQNTHIKRQERVNKLYDHLKPDASTLFDNNIDKYDIVMASDGFFPFADNIIMANMYGVKHVIHPGGSIRDEEITKKCNEMGINITITNHRMFYH